ncbi:MAG: glycosyltransferase family 4 protein, partial [Rhodobacteraceae bacterium]|nr:glycosyltransferase family 4 protein [Paracoccaceae bacterium]
MRLAVNGWRLRTQTGVARVLLNMMRYWTTDMVAGRFDEITVYSPVELDADLPLPPNVRRRVIGPDARMLVWENTTLPWHMDEDVVLCPSYTRPVLTRARTVTLTYEATQKLFPQYYPMSARFIQTPLYGWSARHATTVVTNTAEARADIIRAYRAPADKVKVVPLAPAEVFHPNYPAEKLREVRRKYVGGDMPFFLYVGKLTGRRNVPMIVEGLADMKKRTGTPHRAVIVGQNTTDIDLNALAGALGIGEDVKYHPFVDDADLAPLYSAAAAFVLPYTYESAASLTLIEAQAAGAPVITTGTPGLREVAGEAAL